MTKNAIMCIALILLASCTSQTKPQVKRPEAENLPKWILKLKEDDKECIYADLRSISNYQGNQHLRRLYLITNFPKANQIKRKVFTSIPTMFSIRENRIINCDTQETAVSEELFFSQYWAEGELISKTSGVSQWRPIPKGSIIDVLADVTCKIAPVDLKPEPPADTRIPFIDR